MEQPGNTQHAFFTHRFLVCPGCPRLLRIAASASLVDYHQPYRPDCSAPLCTDPPTLPFASSNLTFQIGNCRMSLTATLIPLPG